MAKATLLPAESSLRMLLLVDPPQLSGFARAAVTLLLSDDEIPELEPCSLSEEDAHLAAQALAHTLISAARSALSPSELADRLALVVR